MDTRTAGPSAAPTVELVPARAFAAMDVEIPNSFALCFPQWWWPSPLRNPEAEAIERDTLEWLRSFGIGCDPAEAEKLRKFDCAKYGGYSLPVADRASATLVTQFISLWLFWDDMQVEEEQGWDIEEVVRALTDPEPPVTASRYVAAWADIGRRLRLTQSDAWLARLATTMRQWLENAKVETGLAKAFKRGQCPSIAEAFEIRTVSIGMYPTFHLVEYTEGVELPAAFHEHPVVAQLERLASRLVGMGNDLGGVAKDIDQRWLNLVLVIHEQTGLPMEQAFARVVEIHNDDVDAFDRLCGRLPSFGPRTDALVQRWIRAVRYNVQGFTRWEAVAERYQELKAVVGGTALVAPVRPIRAREPAMRLATAGTTASPRPSGTAN
jgi:hypothetical protein